MSLWGGRFKFEQQSVTHIDYDDPGKGIRANIPFVPPGVFVGKYGKLRSMTTTKADYQPKEHIDCPAYSLKLSFRLPRPLRCDDAYWQQMTSKYADDSNYFELSSDESACTTENTNQEQLNASDTFWPKESNDAEWNLPNTRQPYHHFNNLRMSGQRERLTSTYTEDLGTVLPGEIADYNLPLSGLHPCGTPLVHTEYDDQFCAKYLRPPSYPQPALHQVRTRAPSCPRWETSYTSMCRETLEAPSWIRDFLAKSYH